ncbi:hypothetical protein [Streptomyces milbemycinicus]|jgi:hypothetical protein|uniref:hypothetical protein n=1 Tax=Streptomyces milbemycinicus TaxID=476552 RepID=UPI0033C22747
MDAAGEADDMTAPAGARRLSPYCQMYNDEPDTTPDEIHAFCKGPGEVRLNPVPPAALGLLLFTVRCDCDCHKTPPVEVLKADAT